MYVLLESAGQLSMRMDFGAPDRARPYDLGRRLYICMHATMRQLTGCSLTIVSTS